MTLDELERAAYIAGDLERADLFGRLMNAEEFEPEVENLSDVVEGIRGRITEANWKTGKKTELRELVEDILSELEEAK